MLHHAHQWQPGGCLHASSLARCPQPVQSAAAVLAMHPTRIRGGFQERGRTCVTRWRTRMCSSAYHSSSSSPGSSDEPPGWRSSSPPPPHNRSGSRQAGPGPHKAVSNAAQETHGTICAQQQQQQVEEAAIHTWRGLPELVAKHLLQLEAQGVHDLLLELPLLLTHDPARTAQERQEFESMYHHLLRAIQVGARDLSLEQLVDVLRVTAALPPPGDYWLRSWCVLTLPRLGELPLAVLLDAAVALLYHNHHPGRSWAASFLACVQKQDAQLGDEDYAVVFQAIMTWQLRPITSARQPLLHLARRSLDVAQSMSDLAMILEIIDYLDGRVEPELQRAVLKRAEQLLGRASTADVEFLMNTLQQYGMPFAVDGSVLAAAVEPLLQQWHIHQIAELLFGVAVSGRALPGHFLDACTVRALQLLPAASAVQQAHLLRAFAAVGHAPPPAALAGWLDRTLEGLQQLSWQARLGLAPASSLAATAGSLGSTLSLSDEDITPAAASAIKSDIISSLESSYAASSGGRGSPFSNSSSSSSPNVAGWSERPQGPAAVVIAAMMDLLAAAAKLQPQVEPSWVLQCLECLEGCAQGIGDAELEQLLLVVEQLGVTPEASWCDAIVQEWSVGLRELAPQQQLGLLRLLVRCQCRPASVWWNQFLAAIEQQLAAYNVEQLCGVLSNLAESDMGGRPPQAWLISHEQHLLARAADLQLAHWSVNLSCYSSLMYRPSAMFVTALEQYTAAGLCHCATGDLVTLVTAAGRLQLPFSDFWEQQLLKGVDKALLLQPGLEPGQFGELLRGLGELEVQMSDQQLQRLIMAAHPLLPRLQPGNICALLRFLSQHSNHSPDQLLPAAVSALSEQLPRLDAPAMLQLLQALKAARFQAPTHFLEALDDQLQQLLPRMDASGLATAMEDVTLLGHTPSVKCQQVLAGCRTLQKGLARASQGMGPAPLWMLVAAVARFDPVPAPALLSVLLPQVAEELAAAAPEDALRVLPTVLAALARWGHAPQPEPILSILHSSTALLAQLPSPEPALQLVHACGEAGWAPPQGWLKAVSERALSGGSWGQLAPGQLLLALRAWASVKQAPDHLPGWPNLMYARCHQLAAAFTQQELVAALSAFAALSLPVPGLLLTALEQRVQLHLPLLPAAQLAAAAHALQVLAHVPSPAWSYACMSAPAGAGWEGYSGRQAAQIICAVANWSPRPTAAWLQAALQCVVRDLRGVSPMQLLSLVGSLALLEHKPGPQLLQALGMAAVAAAEVCEDPRYPGKIQALLKQLSA